MNAPTVKTLTSDIFLPERFTVEQAKKIRELIHNNKPRTVLKYFDETIKNFGLESIHSKDGKLVALYSNTGDSYAPTMLYNVRTQTICISSMGDFTETNNKRYNIL